MAEAFVLINIDIGSEATVLKRIRALSSVRQAHGVYGVYDLICRIEAPDIPSLKDTIVNKIRRIDHVRSTITLICFD